MNPGCIVFVKNGDVKNNTGIIKNAGLFTIENNFINNDTSTAGAASGLYKVKGDFINNHIFTADQGEVLLYGNNQQISGSAVTSFYNLTLAGSGIKTQTIDAHVANKLDLSNLELATAGNKMFVENFSPFAIAETGGFVSSTGNGRLSWTTNQISQYLYPVGSSQGTPRIRPVRITPSQSGSNTFAVRFANVDATNEGYNRALKENNVCSVNDKFYHLIDQTTGTTTAGIAIYYDDAVDGSWAGIGHWQNVPQWQNTSTASTGISGSYEILNINNWNNFSYPAFALISFGQTPTFSVTSGNVFTVDQPGTAYQWYLNGNPIPGATNQTYVATESGNYHVEVTYGDGCVSSSPINEYTYTSVYEIENLTDFSVYPNPGSELISVTGTFSTSENLVIEFTNMLGQRIIEPRSLKNITTLKHTIDVSQLANGVYFISLVTNSGRSSIPFIKN